VNVHELAQQMTEARYQEAQVREKRFKERLEADLTVSAKQAGFTDLNKYRKHLEETGRQKAIQEGYVPFTSRSKKPVRTNLVDLDYLTPYEVDQELIKQANEAGYNGNVACYLANDGHLKKNCPDPIKSLKKLEGPHGKDKEGNAKRIDPHFRLFHDMMSDGK
jgi:hypothetical protein